MNKPRVIRWVALVAGFSLVSLFALVLVLPMVVDTDAVKSRARAFIAEKTAGLTRFEKIDIFWLPRPGVEIRDAAISFDKRIQGHIQRLRLFPSMLHLLTGNLAFSSVTADGVTWIVRLPAPNEEPFNLDELEEKLGAAVQGLALAFPGMTVRIHAGVADIGIAGGRPLIIKDIDADLRVTFDKLDFKIAAGANFADRIRFAGDIATSNLVSDAWFSAENLGLRKIFDFYSPGSAGWINDGAATVSFKLRAAGLKRFSVDVAGLLPSLTLARGGRRAFIAVKDFKGIVSGDEKVFRVIIKGLSLASPQLNVDGEFVFDRPSSTFSVKLTGHDLDAGMIRKSALLLADDVASVQDVFRYVQGGAITKIRVETGGRSFAEAFASNRAVVTASLGSAKIFVPGPDLDLDYVSGAVLISAGVLECKECSATLGKTKGRDGALRVGLAGANRPFHLDIMLEADARELQSLLLSHVKDEVFRKEVSKFHDIAGSVSGRLILGETLDPISVRVAAVPVALTASYEPMQYPISLRGGRLNYADGKIDAESLAGAIGLSTFSGLTGSVRADGTGQLNITSANLQLDLEQTEFLLRKVKTIQAKLGAESSARGKIDFASMSLTGPLNDPSQWDFTGKGKVAGISVKQALLPAPVTITQGTFDATHEKLTFADAEVHLLDGSMKGSGRVENWRKAPLRVEATASGIAGERMMQWVMRQTEIPADYMLRSPLEVSAGHVTWRDDGDFSFNGALIVSHGPRLSIDMARNLGSFTVKDLSVDDAGQSARAKFELAQDQWRGAFSGTLNKQTVDRIFLTAPVSIGLLQGDFALDVFRKPPFRLSARGTLAGRDIVPPVKGEDAVIEQILIQGDQTGLNIRSAGLRWRRSHIAVSGKLAAAQDALQVDMDVSADNLIWEELTAITRTENIQREQGSAKFTLPAVQGIIRLNTDRFAIGALSWNPLRVAAQLTENQISGEIDNGFVCGISTAGRFAVRKNDQSEFDLRFSVKDGDLDSTSRCLSIEKSDIAGTYSVDARVTAGGHREQFAQTLSGTFDFVARDGKFIRSAGVDATFDYLNHTGDFNVAFPDLNKEAFPYQFISAKGTLARQSIFANEIIIEASPYAITAQGKVDLEQKTIDAKGLVTVLLPAGKVIKSIPLVGSIVSGSMVGIPVEVAGALEQPRVSYLSPAALGAELLNIPMRILKLPLGALQIFAPGQSGLEKK